MKRFKYTLLLLFAFCFIGTFAGCLGDGYCIIKLNSPEHATISTDETKVEKGKYIAFKIQCDPGYEVESVLINGQKLDDDEKLSKYKVTKDIVVSCVVKLSTFHIYYENVVDSDFEPSTKTFTIVDNEIPLGIPTRIGADFDGWYIYGENVTSIVPSEYSADIYVCANWKEHFYTNEGYDFDMGGVYQTITSLTEYGKTLKNLETPSTVDGIPVKCITSLFADDLEDAAMEKLRLNQYITDLPDGVWASLKSVSVVSGNNHLIHEGDFIYYVDYDEKILKYVNPTYFDNDNDTLYIGKDVTSVEIFCHPNAISKIKRFMVDKENPYLSVKTSDGYVTVNDVVGYSQGNILCCGDEIIYSIISKNT